MSDATPIEAIPGLNSPAAKVFVEGKRAPVEVQDAYVNVSLMMSDDRKALALSDLDGNGITIPRERIVTVAEQTERIELQGNPFWGKKLTFRGLDAWNQEQVEADSPMEQVLPPEGEDSYIAVIGEDLADALLVVVNPVNGHIAWTNPAEPVRSIKRIVKAARLLAEAQQLADDEHLVSGQTPTSTLRGAGLTEDQINAQQTLEAGQPVSQAVMAGGREFVISFLESLINDERVKCVTTDGPGLLVGAHNGVFTVDLDNGLSNAFSLDGIESVQIA